MIMKTRVPIVVTLIHDEEVNVKTPSGTTMKLPVNGSQVQLPVDTEIEFDEKKYPALAVMWKKYCRNDSAGSSSEQEKKTEHTNKVKDEKMPKPSSMFSDKGGK